MPIPFHGAEEIDELGYAAYLRIVAASDGAGRLGALFTINARGEPIEFTYNRIDMPHTFLWRADDVRRFAARKLTASLLELCPEAPRLILCRADEIVSELFGRDIRVNTAVCRVAPTDQPASHWAGETLDQLEAEEPVNLFWMPAKPSEDSPEHRLLQELAARGLILEPFERALHGLREVYGLDSGEAT